MGEHDVCFAMTRIHEDESERMNQNNVQETLDGLDMEEHELTRPRTKTVNERRWE